MNVRAVAPAQIVVQGGGPSPGVAAVLSFIIPGLGAMYAGSVVLGIVLFVLTVAGYALFVLPGIAMHFISIAVSMSAASSAKR